MPSAFMVFYSLVTSDFVMASGCIVSRAKIFDFLGISSLKNKINLAATSNFLIAALPLSSRLLAFEGNRR